MTQRRLSLDELLAAMPGTQAEMARITRFTRCTVSILVRSAIESKHAHISGWISGKGHPTAIYSAGEGVQAPPPRPTMNALYIRIHRRKPKGKTPRDKGIRP